MLTLIAGIGIGFVMAVAIFVLILAWSRSCSSKREVKLDAQNAVIVELLARKAAACERIADTLETRLH